MSVHSISSSRGGLEIHHVSPPFTEMSHDYEEGIVSLSDDIQNKTKENMNFILFILLLSNLWSILLIVIPVQYTIGSDNLYYKYDGWYGINDILRFIEPIGGVMFSFWIYHSSGHFSKHSNLEIQYCSLIFMFGVSLYCQGGAFHSASVMYKHAVEIYKKDNPGEQYLTDLMYWIRTTWEHEISHYIYAGGAAIMAGIVAWAYRDIVFTKPLPTQFRYTMQILILMNSIVYALLVAAVIINFPSGTIVGLIYLVGYGLGIIGRYLWHHDELSISKFGNRPILHFYFLSYLIALMILILWIIIVGGFKSQSQAL